ncbi:MAG: Ig-like domain-containing protein [Myxococcota bacterium]
MRGTKIIVGASAAFLLQTVSLAHGAPTPATIYINFDGPTLTAGPADDAAADVTAIAELGDRVEAFGDDAATRQAVLEAVRADFAPFDVRVVDSRPGGGDYMMAVVTPTNPFGAEVSGAAVTDCFDAAGRRDVVFAFFEAGGAPALEIASTISQEIGHAVGLEHVQDAADVLYPFATGFDPYFNDTCLTLSAAANCAEQHAVFCDGADEQNSFAELLDAFGSSVDDASPPTVSVFGLADGDVVVAGQDIDIEAEASDDQRVDRVVLYEGGDVVGEDRIAPYAFTVVDIDPGDYEVYAVAIDAAGNESMSEVLSVTAEAPGIPSTGRGGAPLVSTPRGSGADEGCACRSRGSGGGGDGWWLALGLLAMPLMRGRPRRA